MTVKKQTFAILVVLALALLFVPGVRAQSSVLWAGDEIVISVTGSGGASPVWSYAHVVIPPGNVLVGFGANMSDWQYSTMWSIGQSVLNGRTCSGVTVESDEACYGEGSALSTIVGELADDSTKGGCYYLAGDGETAPWSSDPCEDVFPEMYTSDQKLIQQSWVGNYGPESDPVVNAAWVQLAIVPWGADTISDLPGFDNVQDLHVTPIFYGIAPSPPCEHPGMCPDTNYQPIREDEQIYIINGAPTSGSRIWSRADSSDPGSSWWPDVRVYASWAGQVQNITQSPNGYSLEIHGTTEEDEQHTLFYSNLQTLFVKENDTVEAGCIIGTAGPVLPPNPTGIDVTSSSAHMIFYSSVIGDPSSDPTYEDWQEWESPTASTMCGGLASANCKNNNFDFEADLTGWAVTSSSTTVTNGLVTLPPASAIYQDITLDSVSGLYVTLLASNADHVNPAIVKVSLAGEVSTITIPAETDWQQHFEAGPLEPSVPTAGTNIYRLKVYNASTQGQVVSIKSVCLHDAEQGINTPPPNCYFDDPLLNDPDQWEIGGTGDAPEFEQGSLGPITGDSVVHLPLDSYIRGAATLVGDSTEDTTYILTIQGRSVPFNILNTFGFHYNNATIEATFTNEFTSEGDPYTEPDDPEITIHATLTDNSYQTQFVVPSGVTVIGDINILVTGLEDDAQAVDITRICIAPSTGVWPGYNTPGSTVIGQQCQLPIPPPDTAAVTAGAFTTAAGIFGSDPGGAISGFFHGFFSGLDMVGWGIWGADQLRYWFKCFLAGLINGLFAVLTGGIADLNAWGTWIGASFQLGANWLGDFLTGLLQGLLGVGLGAWGDWVIDLINALPDFLAGILAGVVNAALGVIFSIPFLKDILDLLSLAQTFALGIVDLLMSLFDLLLTMAHLLGALGNVIHTFTTSVYTGVNANTLVDFGFSAEEGSCGSLFGDHSSIEYAFCLGLDLSSYTVAAFPSIGLTMLVAGGIAGWFTYLTAQQVAGETLEELGQ